MKYIISFLLPLTGWTCPFCETGANDTALFLVSIFGLFILGMGFLFFAFIKSGGLKSGSKPKDPLEVEETNHG